jgi:formylglycine-generating enzyme required for sulfatase activity
VLRFVIVALCLPLLAAAQPKEIANSIGMRLVRIEPGTFTMGFTGAPLTDAIAARPWRANGDFDERPAHRVRISAGFYVGAYEVTNAQYEQFDPSHKALRGKLGFAKDDNEAVVFVSYGDAVRFCQWLSKKKANLTAFRPRRNGSTPRERAPRPTTTPATRFPTHT